jgi:ElaB/YqjD/DUF883 family membrane-anchored ribosome-binding protein
MNKTRNGSKAVHDAMGSIQDHAVGTAGGIRDLGEAVKDVFIEKLGDLLKRTVSFGERGKEAAVDAAQVVGGRLEAEIRQHPFRTILVAGGVGLVVGLLIRRR